MGGKRKNLLQNGNAIAVKIAAADTSIEISRPDTTNELIRVPLERKRTLFSLVFLVVASILNDIALAWIHDRVPRGDKGTPLPDLWFHLVPEVKRAIRISEWALVLIVGLMLLMMVIHEHRWITIRRVFLIAGICYSMRAICITLTQMPVPSRHTYCEPAAQRSSLGLVVTRVAGSLSGLGLDLYRGRVLCGDLVVSGHTISLTLSYLFLCHYTPKRLAEVLNWVLGILLILAFVCILLSRKHYSIDVLLGYYLSSRVFWIYHSLLRDRRSPLNSVWWFRFHEYFEADAPPPDLWRNRLQWPSACPTIVKQHLPAY